MIVPASDRLGGVEEYYFSVKLQEIRSMVSRGIPVINLGIGNPDLPPSAATIDRLSASAREAHHHGYQSYRGIPELRESIASYLLATHAVRLDPDNEILPLPGSKQGMIYVALAFLNPGDVGLVADLSYPTYSSVIRLAGGRVVTYPLRPDEGWAPDWKALESMDLSGAKLLWANYPHMPTGAPPSRPMLQRLIDVARDRKILICYDNPYSMLGDPSAALSLLSLPGAREVAVELGSMSKSHNMAGWRIGWISGRKDYVDTVLRVATNVESGLFLPLQHAACRALHAAPDWYDDLRSEYARRRQVGTAMLEGLGCTVDPGQAGMFVWARIPDEAADAISFSDHLLQTHHLFITPGSIFGPRGDRYMRLSLCSSLETLSVAARRLSAETVFSLHSRGAS